MTGQPGFGLDRAITATVAVRVPLRLTVFGSMSATDVTGRSVLPKSRKARGVLAVLALQPSRLVLRSELTDLLWSRRDREQARASLRQAIHQLVDLLGPIDSRLLRVDRNHLSLALNLIWVDAQAIAATGRRILYDVNDTVVRTAAWTWAAPVANVWRTTPDIGANYASMVAHFIQDVRDYHYAGRGGWLVGANSVGSLVGWYEGIQVLTC